MSLNCKINNVLKKCIKRKYNINTAQRYLKLFCKITLSNEVLIARHKLLL